MSTSRSYLDRMLFDDAVEPKPVPLSLLEEITNGFSYNMEIGRGGFALVYKGNLQNGTVAIKRLLSTGHINDKDFLQEIDCLVKSKHENIVRFLGYCDDTKGNMDNYNGKTVMAKTKERLLCFEYLPNGGLDHYITDPTCGLEWEDRFDIIKGICEGLHHLHQKNILHLDLKPANILLDETMQPKITDFGISRSFQEGQTRTIAKEMIGTPGYMAPESESNLITKKYDLYSLGVVILEIVTGKKTCQGVENVLKSWSDRPNISLSNQECAQIRACVEIGTQCKEFDATKRPDDMKRIIKKLAETESKEISPRIKTLDIGITSSIRSLHSLDTNYAKQWIITGEDNGHVRIWNCQTQVCILNSAEPDFSLSGHSSSIKSLDFFTLDDKEYLVTGSDDQTAKIWDLAQKTCLCTLEAFESPVMFVLYRPDLQILIAVSQDGSIYWSRICSRIHNRAPKIKQTVRTRDGSVIALASSMGRVVIAKSNSVAIMDIDCMNSNNNSTDYSEPHLSADIRPGEDKTSKVIIGSSEELPILDVDPMELRSSELNEPITCSLHVTNNTDENVAFRITEESRQSLRCSSEIPTYYILPPRSRYSLVVTTGHEMTLDGETEFNVTVQSSTSGERYVAPFISQSECDEFFEDAKEMENIVHEVTLRASYALQRDMASKYNNELHPLKHRLYPTQLSGDSIPSLLHLTNKTDKHVIFRLVKRSSDSLEYDTRSLKLYGGVLPKSICTLIMTEQDKELIRKKGIDLVLQSTISGNKENLQLYKFFSYGEVLEKAKEMGHAVYEVALLSQGDTASQLSVRPTVMKVRRFIYDQPILLEGTLSSMDIHPTEPWIVIGYFDGNICIWNHETKTMMGAFKISEKPVWEIKFHAKKKWIVAGTNDELIHVYDFVCETQIQKITSFRAPNERTICKLAIHPTKPYVLSASMKLWNGDKGWESTHTFGTSIMLQLTFNPEDPNSFASAMFNSNNGVQVWSLGSAKPDYTLYGHSKSATCLDFFKRGDQLYLITGSDDCTAKIWDLQTRACIHTLESIMSPVKHVISIPGRPYLVTCSDSDTVYVYSSADFSLKTTVNFSAGGSVMGLVCFPGSRRIAICHFYGISTMDIDDVEEAVAREGNNEDSIVHENPSWVTIDDVEEAASSEGKYEDSIVQGNPSRGSVVVGQEKAISILEIHDDEEAVADRGTNKKSIVPENTSTENRRERWSWKKDEVTGAWTRVKVSSP